MIFTSDNGLAFGEHRWTKKSCPYEACIGVPFLIRMPGGAPDGRVDRLGRRHRTDDRRARRGDAAGDVRRCQPGPLLTTGSRVGLPGEVFAEWVGDQTIPAWWEVRTRRFAYIELATGERELYALRDDPYELTNVADDPAFGPCVAARGDPRDVPGRVRRTAAIALGALLPRCPAGANGRARGRGPRPSPGHRPHRDRRSALRLLWAMPVLSERLRLVA